MELLRERERALLSPQVPQWPVPRLRARQEPDYSGHCCCTGRKLEPDFEPRYSNVGFKYLN